MITKIGIIGLGSRGTGLLGCLLAHVKGVEIIAVCDLYVDKAENACQIVYNKTAKKPTVFSDYNELLKMPSLQAVIVSTSWEAHAEVAIAGMNAGIPVAMEAGGAYTIKDCWDLVDTYEKTRTPFMLLENCCYDKTELMATNMARHGLFGDIVHCSGAYSHDLRDEVTGGNINRHYRLRNYIARNCENYPTHELGPIAKILDINRGNRLVSLVSIASRAAGLEQYVIDNAQTIDKTLIGKKFAQGDIVNTIITCANGSTILLTLDTTLPTVYDRALVIKGTHGMYNQSSNFAVLDNDKSIPESWTGIENHLALIDSAVKYEEEFLPSIWKNITEEDKKSGHGGMDGFILQDFIDCVSQNKEMPIDVYDAVSWMCVSCLSEDSIRLGGAAQLIPDFTKGKWLQRARKDVINF